MNIKRIGVILSIGLLICLLWACEKEATVTALPKAEVDTTSMFGTDANINIATIDNWVDRDDVVYRDMRMLVDPVQYCEIDGDRFLSGTIRGFEVVPYPFLANFTGLPEAVGDARYDGPTLFTLTWDSEGNIETITPNYRESEVIIHDLFPKDQPVFLMCGGGGYAAFTKALLLKLGYNAELLYNLGGFWAYNGDNKVNTKVSYGENNEHDSYSMHRLFYHFIDFDLLYALNESS